MKVSEPNPVPEGQTVTFTCLSDANPPVSLYTWYRVDSGHVRQIQLCFILFQITGGFNLKSSSEAEETVLSKT